MSREQEPNSEKNGKKQTGNVINITEGQRETLRIHIAAMLEAGFSCRDLASQIQIGASTLSMWVRDKYDRSDERILEKISKWRRAQEEAEARRAWIPTESSTRVLDMLTRSLETGEMIAIYGGPGIGKTTAARHFTKTISPWLVTCSPATSGLIPALQAVAATMGVVADGGAARISSAIRMFLGNEPGILILDEAQHLSMAAVEEFRSIHDEIGLGLVLMGNEHSYTRFVGSARSANFAQIRSRFGATVHLPRVESEDVRVLAKAWGVSDSKVLTQLEEIAARPGALRSVTKVLRLARAGRGKVNEDAIHAACRTYGAEV